MRVIFEGSNDATIEAKLEDGNISLYTEETGNGLVEVSLSIEETNSFISRLIQLIDQKESEEESNLSFFQKINRTRSKWTR